MGFSPASKKLLSRVYFFGVPILLMIACYVIGKQGKPIEAILLGLIGLLATFYYYLKFFVIGKTAQEEWPPYVSTCPDYLTLINPAATGDSDPVCMDFIGVALSGASQQLIKTDSRNIPKASTGAAYESHVFRVKGVTDADAMCANVKSRGLTWAHVCE